MAEETVLYAAVYGDVNAALADLEAFEDLHKADMVGNYDAAVIEKEDGKPHIVKRVDHPRIRVIPELLGSGNLPSNELKDAADQLSEDQAGLVVVGEPTLEKGFDTAITRAASVVKRDFNTATDRLSAELSEGLKH